MRKDDDVARRERDGLSLFPLDDGAAFDHQMVENEMLRARGEIVAANAAGAGVENPQGAENSAVKNTAPFNFTPVRISENASIQSSGLSAKSPGP